FLSGDTRLLAGAQGRTTGTGIRGYPAQAGWPREASPRFSDPGAGRTRRAGAGQSVRHRITRADRVACAGRTGPGNRGQGLKKKACTAGSTEESRHETEAIA